MNNLNYDYYEIWEQTKLIYHDKKDSLELRWRGLNLEQEREFRGWWNVLYFDWGGYWIISIWQNELHAYNSTFYFL